MSRRLGKRGKWFAAGPLLVAFISIVAAAATQAAARPEVPGRSTPGAVKAPGQADDPLDPLLRQAIGYYTGAGGQVDDPRAHDLLVEAAADGDSLSSMWLARCYSRGRMLFEQDEARARELAAAVIDDVIRLAKANHPEAAFLLGTAYAEGFGVPIDRGLSLAWHFRAADLDNMLAQHNLGNFYRQGSDLPADPEMAAYWYRRAADQGDALPAFWLGEMYENGEGLPRDREQALRWYREGARRGNRQSREALQRLGG